MEYYISFMWKCSIANCIIVDWIMGYHGMYIRICSYKWYQLVKEQHPCRSVSCVYIPMYI